MADSYTKLLIHSKNADGSTSIIDSSDSNHTISRGGGVAHTTDQAKFWSSSIYFDGVDDYLTLPATHTDWDFGTGDFTVDMWVKLPSLGEWTPFISHGYDHGGSDGAYWGFWFSNSTGLTLYTFYGTEVNQYHQQGNTTGWDTTNWHHVAFGRESGTIRVWLDGTVVATTPSFTQNLNTSENFSIGRNNLTGYGGPCYIDEVRVSKGINRFGTSSFAVPTAPYDGWGYSISGALGQDAKLYVINEATDTLERVESFSAGSYEMACGDGDKLIIAKATTGQALAYGGITPTIYTP